MSVTERLVTVRTMIANMTSEQRPPRTSIPPQPTDEDVFIITALEDAIAALDRMLPRTTPYFKICERCGLSMNCSKNKSKRVCPVCGGQLTKDVARGFDKAMARKRDAETQTQGKA